MKPNAVPYKNKVVDQWKSTVYVLLIVPHSPFLNSAERGHKLWKLLIFVHQWSPNWKLLCPEKLPLSYEVVPVLLWDCVSFMLIMVQGCRIVSDDWRGVGFFPNPRTG